MHNITESELIKIVVAAIDSNTETEKVEFKDARQGIPKELWRPISSFSNSPGGGLIVFGITQQTGGATKVVGGLDLATLQEKVVSYLREKMKYHGDYALKVFELDGQKLLALLLCEIPRESKPCYYQDLGMPRGVCIRAGNTNRPITEEELRSFLRFSPQYKYDRSMAIDTDLELLSREKIAQYLEKSAKRTGRSFSSALPFEKVLKNLGVIIEQTGKQIATVGGYLTFAKDPPQELEQFSRYIVRCVRYAGSTTSSPIIDQKDVSGTLDLQIDEVHKFILKNISMGAKIVGTKRVEDFEYPTDAIREIVANAIIHRDYMITGTYTQVVVFADRIEISNPGTLPPGITIDNLKESQFSRNEVIANLMRGLDYMEEFGRGIDLIYARMTEYNLVKPLFKNRSNTFKATLLGSRFEKLNERQVKIWDYLQEFSQINISTATKLLPKISRATVNNDLKGLVVIGLITPQGASNSTYYEPKY
jgi:predicted HTH transcriptional regulator